MPKVSVKKYEELKATNQELLTDLRTVNKELDEERAHNRELRRVNQTQAAQIQNAERDQKNNEHEAEILRNRLANLRSVIETYQAVKHPKLLLPMSINEGGRAETDEHRFLQHIYELAYT